MLINVSEAKANLSKLVNMAYQGEKITIAKNNLPLVDLVVHKPENKRKIKQAFGLYKDKKTDGLVFQKTVRDEW
ncbi:MAG: type II toxin-antitoxin system prevent-host-death family antitoxin [Candidatus Thioglobus sp.]|jgi:antitoxin (DNA-binding transcriptional repressor) of toxin-antitoxin stability system|uniref:type II toxin-antitoxin system Phd/YefM family antitoxin n=1 Tax=Candidatus Thioglobus sp. TaxID=2026721 RepID=UPI001EC666E7|nr:type II toxin-antitoxin system prevent-host-death family antitoxin [Candidatus Thioglobus sp.]MBT3186299.1 type II toxin-antitoxin system prevent-host-death family antitoxin [Candidatus Thioglobus sp.]MBT3432219.1 type II toxin-antitoxin system prevent-host-death family antitoxin [Candidatus Thioglobus sp.]MBT3964906.1 type II toxin-antitoxin system prevent-host-death family antitoxin [Candidatus Thioglobus sp.]MBT4315776.1 type II toxin-antitoxin system prevent-host-death family antitoxin [